MTNYFRTGPVSKMHPQAKIIASEEKGIWNIVDNYPTSYIAGGNKTKISRFSLAAFLFSFASYCSHYGIE